MALVTSPKSPENGETRWKLEANCQSTVPANTGASPDTSASPAETTAIGMANRVTHRTPARLTRVKSSTRPIASGGTGTSGRYHCVMAEAERIAVKPQVGTQPHQ